MQAFAGAELQQCGQTRDRVADHVLPGSGNPVGLEAKLLIGHRVVGMHGDAHLVADHADPFGQVLALGLRQAGAGLVEDGQPGVGGQGPGEVDEPLLGRPQPGHRLVGQRLDAEELQELDAYKGQLIATVAHELKNPLTSVLGHLEMLESAPDLSTTATASLTFGREHCP